MKRWIEIVILVMVPLLAIGGLYLYLQAQRTLPSDTVNHEKKALMFKDNTLQCPHCHMYLVGYDHTAQIITEDLKTHFFDDVGCAMNWIKEQKLDASMLTIWVHSRDTKAYIDAKKAWYSVDEATPMQYGFGAYSEPKSDRIEFDEMRLRVFRGESMQDVKVRHQHKGH